MHVNTNGNTMNGQWLGKKAYCSVDFFVRTCAPIMDQLQCVALPENN